MIRLFVALELPESIRERLAALGGGVPGARWVAPENMHLTLRFIGDVAESWLPDIDSALSRIGEPPFEMTLSEVGHFGTKDRTRALWIGVVRNRSLEHLQGKIESALVRTGLPPAGRKFTPHVTLARLKRGDGPRLGRFLAAYNDVSAGPIDIDSFTLFSSQRSPNGPLYRVEEVYPLRV